MKIAALTCWTLTLCATAMSNDVIVLGEHAGPFKNSWGFAGTVVGIAISPDQALAVSADSVGTFKVWDLTQQKELREVKTGSWITRIQFSPNGKLLATAHEDAVVRIWDVSEWKLRGELRRHRRCLECLTFLPSGLLATGGGNDDRNVDRKLNVQTQFSEVFLWNVETREVVGEVPLEGGRVRSVAASADGKFLAFVSADYAIRIWDVASQEVVHYLPTVKRYPVRIAYSKQGLLGTGGLWAEAALWNPPEPEPVRTFETAESAYDVCFSADGTKVLVYISSSGIGIQVFDVRSGECMARLVVLTKEGRAVAPKSPSSYDPDAMIIRAEYGRVCQRPLKLQDGEYEELPFAPRVGNAALSPDGTFAVASVELKVVLWRFPESVTKPVAAK